MAKYRILYDPDHPVFAWIKQRNIKSGSMPLPVPVADKAGGKKGKPIPLDNKALTKHLLLNGNNMTLFRVLTRIGGFFINSAQNKHLISLLGKIIGKIAWWVGNYVPYPLKKGLKAFGEKIYMVGNVVEVDKIKGKYAHLKAGIAQLTQVDVVTGRVYSSNVRWFVPAGWVERSLLEKI